MQITLYMAPSLDGYIALPDGDSEWVSEVCGEEFMKTINEYGCIIYGSHTYTQYFGELYPVKDVTNIVITQQNLDKQPNTYFVSSPALAVEKAKELGHAKALLIGGGTTNGHFLDQQLINEIFLDYHPIILGSGIRLFGDSSTKVVTQLVSQIELGQGVIHAKYKIIPSI